MIRHNLFIPGKLDYVTRKNRPNVDCILCSYHEGSHLVELLTVHESELFYVACNLYPYNPGHLIVFPKRHVEDIREMTGEEKKELLRLQERCMDVLDSVYQPQGFNIGCNIGDASGASISHFHVHIVPRYRRELGFVDILAGAKNYVEDPHITMEKLRKAFQSLGDR